jgi:hypothetical protein
MYRMADFLNLNKVILVWEIPSGGKIHRYHTYYAILSGLSKPDWLSWLCTLAGSLTSVVHPVASHFIEFM